jgi:hypothetical protein
MKNLHSNKLIVHFFTILFIAVSFVSCGGEDEINEAKLISIDQVRNSPEYFWFDTDYNSYNIDNSIINDIKQVFDSSHHKIIILPTPSCLCGSKYTYFPKLIKIFDSAGIRPSNYELYAVSEVTFDYPFSNIYKVDELPTAIILKDGNFVYSIYDSLKKSELSNPNITMEEIVLNGLSK